MDNINSIFIDGSYFIFYRYYALIQWWGLAHKDEPLDNPINNAIFVEKFKQTFYAKIEELKKKFKINSNVKIYIGKDCPRKNIWRLEHFADYKKNRVYEDTHDIKHFFKLVYTENLFTKAGGTILECSQLEADDCIALAVKQLLSHNKSNILIITSDHDYCQLLNENIFIYNLKYKNLLDSPNIFNNGKKNLFIKIVMGDKSDNIPSVINRCGIKTSIKYYENATLFKEKITCADMEKFKLNNLLINFDMIPKTLVDQFYKYNTIC